MFLFNSIFVSTLLCRWLWDNRLFLGHCFHCADPGACVFRGWLPAPVPLPAAWGSSGFSIPQFCCSSRRPGPGCGRHSPPFSWLSLRLRLSETWRALSEATPCRPPQDLSRGHLCCSFLLRLRFHLSHPPRAASPPLHSVSGKAEISGGNVYKELSIKVCFVLCHALSLPGTEMQSWR